VLYLITIFIGAFLLFQIQPLIAKLILPFFGGGAAVWTACLLFFQAFLLLGYGYAHLLTQMKSYQKQVNVHLVLLVLSLLTLPIGLTQLSAITLTDQPLIKILLLLTLSIGLPYLLLSSTGPLVQRWLSISVQEKLPYKLYSLSNFASLLALLSFPFVFELLLSSEKQAFYWSLSYGVYVVFFVLLGRQFSSNVESKLGSNDKLSREEVSVNLEKSPVWLWLALSAIGVVLLVSTTNAMTQNVPPVPFLWILPLCIYLLTFIISFHNPKWYVRWYWFVLFILTALIAVFMYFIGSRFDIISQVVIYSSILFSACMICHGELARLKPAVEQLTWYYLLISFGGFLGSAFVAFIAQNVFQQFLEFPLAIVTMFVLLAWSIKQDKKYFDGLAKVSILLSCLFALTLGYLNNQYVKTDVMSVRNFYGILSVKDVDINGKKERRLIDGTTSHGTQSLDVEAAHIPLSYYRANTGVALALEHLGKRQALNAGFIGLGAGTLAAYGRAGDSYRFYELNPAVSSAAQEYFSYLKDSAAKITIALGDGRVSLTNEWKSGLNHQFDLLVVDAFSGDSIPQHLLTVEALELYWQHLTGDGVLAVHISNTHLNLSPLMRGLAQQSGKEIRYFKTQAKNDAEHDTEWVLITNNKSLLNNSMVKAYASRWSDNKNNIVLWTDNNSSLWSVLK